MENNLSGSVHEGVGSTNEGLGEGEYDIKVMTVIYHQVMRRSMMKWKPRS